LAHNNVVLTLSLLNHRNLAPNALCPRCSSSEETFLHCIRDCPTSTRLWHALGFTSVEFFSNTDVSCWLKQGLTTQSSNIFVAGVWWSWRNWNSICFSNISILTYRLAMEARNLSTTLISCFSGSPTPTIVDKWVRWNSSNQSCIILNVDGSCLGNPIRAGFGGLLRHQTGHWITGFSGYIAGTSDILLAELHAIHRGLLLAKEMNFQEVFCYTDSLHCVQILKELTPKFHKYATLIQDIKDLLNLDWQASIDHTLREGNNCADFLAKTDASSTSELVVHISPPTGLFDLLDSDSAGTRFRRL